jgi:broad specificity phosphatase PhoE
MVAGTLRRQRDTATTCAEAAGWSLPLESDARLNEYDHIGLLRDRPAAPEFGPAGGRAVQEALDAALLDWMQSDQPGSDGRTFVEWRDGALAAQRDFLGSLERGSTGLMFTSGGVLAVICADLLGLGAEGFVALSRVAVNASVTKIVSGRGGTNLISFNDHGHLEGAADLVTYR